MGSSYLERGHTLKMEAPMYMINPTENHETITTPASSEAWRDWNDPRVQSEDDYAVYCEWRERQTARASTAIATAAGWSYAPSRIGGAGRVQGVQSHQRSR